MEIKMYLFRLSNGQELYFSSLGHCLEYCATQPFDLKILRELG